MQKIFLAIAFGIEVIEEHEKHAVIRSEIMEQRDIYELLCSVSEGKVSVDEAMLSLKQAPFKDIGFAKPDFHRALRQGTAEVIYGEGKTVQQIIDIAQAMKENGQQTIIITRLNPEYSEHIAQVMPINYNLSGKIGVIGSIPEPNGNGKIIIATGGTSDMPVAEEAAVTSEALGNETVRLYDVGVSGLHRLLSNMDEIMSAQVIIAVAGMEGALASVIGGLCDCPVIAVPTSVGYGANFGGLSALLAMLNSCSSGVGVVNIDNGFGAAYLANMINHLKGGNYH